MQALLGRAHRQGCYGRRTNGHSVPRLRHPARRRRGQGRVPKNVGAGRVEHVSNGLWLPDEVPRRRKVRERDLASHRPPDCMRPMPRGAAPPKTSACPSTRTEVCTTPMRSWSTLVRTGELAASTSGWPPDTTAPPPSGRRRAPDSRCTPPDPPRPACFAHWAPAKTTAPSAVRLSGTRPLSSCRRRGCNLGESARA